MTEWCDRALVRAPYFCLCLTVESFHHKLKRIGIAKKNWPAFQVNDTSGATCFTFEKKTPRPKLCCIVTLRPDHGLRDGVEVAALLVHEAVHIWQKTRESIGEDSPSKEFEAYAIQNIAGELMQSFAKQTRRARN